MWKLLLTQFKLRASRPLFILTVIAGFIATYVYLHFAKNGSPSTQLKVAPLVCIAGVLFAISGYFWFKKPLGNIKLTCCHNCNYNLLGQVFHHEPLGRNYNCDNMYFGLLLWDS